MADPWSADKPLADRRTDTAVWLWITVWDAFKLLCFGLGFADILAWVFR